MEIGLKNLNAEDLIQRTQNSVAQERHWSLEVIHCLREISDRKLFLERGFPSLFEMVTKHFQYSASAAQRRIDSMRLLKDLPELEVKIESGELNLSTTASIQSFLRHEKKADRSYSKVEKLELAKVCENKSAREVQKELAERSPSFVERESVRAIGEDRYRMNITISDRLEKKLRRLKSLLAHSDPSMTNEDLIDRMAELALEKFDPVRKAERTRKKAGKTEGQTGSRHMIDSLPTSVVAPRSRYIAAKDKTEVWRLAGDMGCAYVDEKSGRRCGSQYLLQVDHRRPFSLGGSNHAANLRLLCSQHNRWAYAKMIGVTKPMRPNETAEVRR
jgi:hypothetical protein